LTSSTFAVTITNNQYLGDGVYTYCINACLRTEDFVENDPQSALDGEPGSTNPIHCAEFAWKYTVTGGEGDTEVSKTFTHAGFATTSQDSTDVDVSQGKAWSGATCWFNLPTIPFYYGTPITATLKCDDGYSFTADGSTITLAQDDNAGGTVPRGYKVAPTGSCSAGDGGSCDFTFQPEFAVFLPDVNSVDIKLPVVSYTKVARRRQLQEGQIEEGQIGTTSASTNFMPVEVEESGASTTKFAVAGVAAAGAALLL
jgi:hypothetical protein